jgi:CheY-like chemotaxis protein
VQSVRGEGSIFSVDVPLGTRVPDAAAAHRRAPSRNVGVSRPVVLLVDDDRAVLDATTMLLEAAGIEVHSALNGDEALAVIDDGVRPDILVSDYRLPRYDGIEVIDRVRDATVKELPAVLLTGDTSAGTLAARNIPNCAILQKPVDVHELVSLIEQSPGASSELPR